MSKVQSLNDFGLLVTYLIPGATLLLGLSLYSETLRMWFATASDHSPTIGGFLYLTVAALAAGMTISALRWAIVDTLQGWTGLKAPALDFSKMGKNVDAFGLLIEIHYRHYLFYANMFVALAFAYVCYRLHLGIFTSVSWLDLGFVALEVIFFVTSRDTLRKYYQRGKQLLSS